MQSTNELETQGSDMTVNSSYPIVYADKLQAEPVPATQSAATNQEYPAFHAEAEPDINYGEEPMATPNSSDPSNNTNGSENPHTKRELRGAAVAGGVAGLILGGPIVAAVAAGGAALAVTNKGGVGKAARAGGEAVASVGDRIKSLDKKHRVLEKTGKGFTKGCNWVSKKIKPKDANDASPQQSF